VSAAAVMRLSSARACWSSRWSARSRLGFLFVMHGIARLPLGAPPAVLSPDAIAVAGIAEDDLADQMTSR
jgi:hypothetical protein